MADTSLTTSDSTPRIATSGIFDPHAVTPAFARPPSLSTTTTAAATTTHHPFSAPNAVEPTTTTTTTSFSRLSIPELGETNLMGELPTTDPLSILLQKHLPPHIRPVRDLSGSFWTTPSITSVSVPNVEIPDPFSRGDIGYAAKVGRGEAITPQEDSVLQAAATNSWRKIATFARSMVEEYGNTERQRMYATTAVQQGSLVDHSQGSTTSDDGGEGMGVGEVLQWWTIRLYSLARLRLYSMLRTELGALWQILSTTPVLNIGGEIDAQGKEKGLMLIDTHHIPFTLRVLRASEPKFRGHPRTTIEQYTLLIQLCKRQIRRLKTSPTYEARGEESSITMWKSRAERVGLMLAFTLVEVKDYSGAIELLLPLIESALDPKRGGEKEKEKDVEERVQLVVVASRVWILAGDLGYAETLLDRVESLLISSTPAAGGGDLQQHIVHGRALIAAIRGNFESSSSLLSHSPSSTPTLAIASRLNSAIVEFYSAKLDQSITTLEQVLHSEPALLSTADATIFNISTLYELAAGGEREVVERKRGLLERVARWAAEPGPGGSSFKL